MTVQDDAAREWRAATTALQEAKVLLREQLPSGATSRAYHARFHAATAVMRIEGRTATSHESLQRMFSDHACRTGPQGEASKMTLQQSSEARDKSDYGDFEDISQDEAAKDVEDAGTFLSERRQELLDKGLDPKAIPAWRRTTSSTYRAR